MRVGFALIEDIVFQMPGEKFIFGPCVLTINHRPSNIK